MTARLALAVALAVTLVPGPAVESAESTMPLLEAPVLRDDPAALQRGARSFVRYCLGCHPASLLRWNRLLDIGFKAQQVQQELLPRDRRMGDPMSVAMRRADAERWFGVAPPDLSLVVRARTTAAVPGRDWVYSYLRGFYRDPTRPTGWNNVVFPNVAMHHVLAELQGVQTLAEGHRLTLARPGAMTTAGYDALVADLVVFLEYVSEPHAKARRHVGRYVVFGTLVLVLFAFALKPPPRRPGGRRPGSRT